ncbi:MAG TPA: hypothetical protein DCZ91_17570 [Lachnospiraceae bacterium]|nr:hypothetical protein [Lachnospiraceae bacterium]
MIIQICNLCLTGLLTVYVVCRYKKDGAARAGVMGTGFFAVAFYLDSIFRLIMGNAADAVWESSVNLGNTGLPVEVLLQLVGILVSRSIPVIFLITTALTGLDSDADVQDFPGRNRDAGRKFGYSDALTICITLLFMLLALHCLEDGAGSRYSDFSLALRLSFLLALLLGYYVSLYLHDRKQHIRRVRTEAEAQKQEAALYLKNVEEQYQRTRELWHDLKNHISLLSMLLQEGKYSEMSDYLRIFGDDIDSLSLPVKSGNLVVDALLADKAARAKKDNIPMELSLCDLTGLSLKPDEICGLLGNLLDNALEANRQVAEGRFLRVECRKRANCYYMKVQNSAVNTERAAMANVHNSEKAAWDSADKNSGKQGKMSENRFQSHKTDRRNQVGHGLGLRSVERTVHACGGELAVEQGEDCFTVVVRLPDSR